MRLPGLLLRTTPVLALLVPVVALSATPAQAVSARPLTTSQLAAVVAGLPVALPGAVAGATLSHAAAGATACRPAGAVAYRQDVLGTSVERVQVLQTAGPATARAAVTAARTRGCRPRLGSLLRVVDAPSTSVVVDVVVPGVGVEHRMLSAAGSALVETSVLDTSVHAPRDLTVLLSLDAAARSAYARASRV